MPIEATIESGFAHVTDGMWLMSSSQPAAYCGRLQDLRMRGWVVPDRGRLRLVEVSGSASCSDASDQWKGTGYMASSHDQWKEENSQDL